MQYYYWMGLAKVIRQTMDTRLAPHRRTIIEQLIALQKPNGSWANESHMMREDDPLIATAMAITALSELLAGRASGR